MMHTSWRAIRDGRGYLLAVLCTALTVALHFETGYLALSVLIVWPWVAGIRRGVQPIRIGDTLRAGSMTRTNTQMDSVSGRRPPVPPPL